MQMNNLTQISNPSTGTDYANELNHLDTSAGTD